MKRQKSLIKNTIIIAFGTLLPKFASIITLPIITANLSKIEYGTYDFISILVSLLLPILTLQIQSGAFRYLIDVDSDDEKAKSIISTTFIFTLFVSIASFIISYFLFFNLELKIRILIMIYFSLNMILSLFQQFSRGLGRNKDYSKSAVIVSLINAILVIVFVNCLNKSLLGLLESLVVPTFFSIIFLFIRLNLYKKIKIKLFSLKVLKELLSYSIPIIPNSISNWIMNLSDRLIITFVLGLEQNAIYSIANKIPNLFTTFQGTFVMAWQENASKYFKDKDSSIYYSEMFDSVTKIYFGVISLLISFSPFLFSILIKGDYHESYFQMPILFIGILFSGIASFIGGIYIALKKTKNIAITTFISAIINLVVNVLLINYIGIYAGSISTLVSYLYLSIYRMKNINKFIKIDYKYKSLLFQFLIVVIISIISYIDNFWVIILNIFIAFIFTVVLNKKILNDLKKEIFKKINHVCK